MPSWASGKIPCTDSAITWAAEWRIASISECAPASRSSSTEPRSTVSKNSSGSADAGPTAFAASLCTSLAMSPARLRYRRPMVVDRNTKPPVRQDERFLSRFHPPSRRLAPRPTPRARSALTGGSRAGSPAAHGWCSHRRRSPSISAVALATSTTLLDPAGEACPARRFRYGFGRRRLRGSDGGR